MTDCVPFVNTETDCAILKSSYADARVVRVSTESVDRIRQSIPGHIGLWIDPAVDGYHQILTGDWPKDRSKWKDWQKSLWQNWERLFGTVPHSRVLLEKKPWVKEHEVELGMFVRAVLDRCLQLNPLWVTVPQLPFTSDRARVNKCLARACATWRSKISRDIKLILPLIISSPTVLNTKPSRDRLLAIVTECTNDAGADGIWVVDASLSDQSRNTQYPKRYAKLIEFHTILKERLPRPIMKVAGPYWAFNLVLWARGLCDFPAMSLGTAYTYYISCGRPSAPNIRVAIPPIRRWAVVGPDFKVWLDKAVATLDPSDSTYKELTRLKQDLVSLANREAAVRQVARFHSEWLRKIEGAAPSGRALALYQDLSSAFVVGRRLPPLPKSAVPYAAAEIRESGKVAEQLMLQCL
ncbi:MAG: hypothetical protein JW955_18010 [Sedimentisphaerales bacterium]|nr:hypothetical protein [Sedimentisphaerales bacterium]